MSGDNVSGFVPQILATPLKPYYATFLVEVNLCKKCGRGMVNKPRSEKGWGQRTFPHYFVITFEEQCKRANLAIASDVKVDDEHICIDCEKKGLADFLCVMCSERKPSDKIQEQYGDPPELLCSDCYANKTAKEWAAETKRLSEKHRWDYE
jgi:hypothetical protein